MSVETEPTSALLAARQAGRYRIRAHRAEAIVAQQNRFIIQILLQDQLADVEDFYTFIGLDAVLSPEGWINHAELQMRVIDLVRRKPHLAASRGRVSMPDREAPEAPIRAHPLQRRTT